MRAAVAIPVLAVAVGFVAACLVVLARGAPPRYLPKWGWALVICCANPWGGVLFLALGRACRTGPALDALAPLQPHEAFPPGPSRSAGPSGSASAAPAMLARRPSAAPVVI